MARIQDWVFTLAVTASSRLLLSRDRLLGRLRVQAGPVDSRIVAKAYALQSGNNLLDAQLVRPEDGSLKAAVLLCHGIGETVAHWDAAQRLLAQNGVASLVFNYSGYGKSSGWITSRQCEADALVAFDLLQRLVPDVPTSILGYSLGSGVATAVAARVRPHKLVLCAAFTSLREAAVSLGVPRFLTRLLPPVWVNVDSLRTCRIPVLVVHGQADRLFPPRMARQLGESCGSECEVIVVPGVSHDGPVSRPELAYWSLVTSRLCEPESSERRSLAVGEL